MFRRTKRHGLAHWAWWQVLALTVFVSGFLGAMLGFFPPVSLPAMRIGLLLAVPTTIAALWNWWTYHWWARLVAQGLLTVQILAIAMRGWMLVLGVTWIWLVPILSAYLLAWAMPALNPRFAAILWREQWTPETQVGKAVLALALVIGPSAGVLGAAFGMFGGRAGEINAVIAVGAALSSMGAIGFAFAVAYQLWPERPWAKNTVTDK